MITSDQKPKQEVTDKSEMIASSGTQEPKK